MQINKNKIELVMARKQITQEELAKAYGATRGGLSSILRKPNANPSTVGRLAAVLGVDLEEIIVTKEVM